MAKNSTPQTVFDFFLETAKKFPENPALFYKKGHHFEFIPYKRFYNLVGNLSLSLEKLGVKKGDRVVLISENRPEWVVSDLSVMSLGAISVPIHNVLSAKQYQSIIKETEPKIVIVSNKETLEKVREIKSSLKEAKIIYLDSDLSSSDRKGWEIYTFIETLQLVPHGGDLGLDTRAENLDPEDILTIIYTSGTTGNFKGVELTHKNIVSNILSVLSVVPVYKTDRFLSILPLSHVFERTVGYYVSVFQGAATSYVIDPLKLAEIAAESKPTIIIAVPRLYEKVYEKISEKANTNIITKTIFKLAFWYGKGGQKSDFLHRLFDKIVFSKIKNTFGGKVRFFVSGAAPLSSELGEFFQTLGMVVLEGYGLTETSPIVSCNRLESPQFGTVGRPLPGVQVKIAKDKEILVKGSNVMKGYYKNPFTTKEVFTKDGWFKTGDLGKLERGGYLRITGRKKELIVLSTGKNVSPTVIEEKLEMSPYVNQVMICGDGKKHIAGIIVPDFKKIGEKFKIRGKTRICQDQKILECLKSEFEKILSEFASYERLKKFVLVPEPFTIKNGQMTPTLKLRRHVILEKYKKEVEGIYREE